MWFFLVVVVIAVIAVILVVNAIVIVPAIHFGVVVRFGKRTGRILDEGFHPIIPFIDSVHLISTELAKIPVKVGFTTKDKLQLLCEGSLQYRPDPAIGDDEGRNIFIAVSDEVIQSGIEDAIQSRLGGLGGLYDGDQFIQNRQALGDLINTLLQLDQPPHLDHDVSTCKVSGCTLERQIDAEHLIEYYKSHWRQIKDVVSAKKQTEETSDIEKRYGIEVVVFALAEVSFSEETQQAFEEEKQAAARARAFTVRGKVIDKLLKRGATPQQAIDEAGVMLEPEIAKNKQVISVQGDAGVLGGFLAKLQPKAKNEGRE